MPLIDRSYFRVMLALVIGFFAQKFVLWESETEYIFRQGNFLLVIAHPDDELMFFSPLLQKLATRITILCLSDGDYYNQGLKRREEMKNVCDRIGATFYISSDFSDGQDWASADIAKYIQNLNVLYNFSAIFTFDEYGVSGHKNHIACNLGVKEFVRSVAMPVYLLRTKNMISKYFYSVNFTGLNFAIDNYLFGVKLMMLYESQMVWFRYLYLMFSNYMIKIEFDQFSRDTHRYEATHTLPSQ